jgi:guanylate kinase
MINDQIQRLMYKLSARPENVMRDLADIELEAEKIVKQSSIFDQIPIENRVKRFIVKRNDETIEAIKQRVEGAREIYDQIYRAI